MRVSANVNVNVRAQPKVLFSNRRALGGHSGTWALRGNFNSQKALGHLATRKALEGHSGLWAFKALGHLGNWAFMALGHLDTRRTLFRRLIISDHKNDLDQYYYLGMNVTTMTQT